MSPSCPLQPPDPQNTGSQASAHVSGAMSHLHLCQLHKGEGISLHSCALQSAQDKNALTFWIRSSLISLSLEELLGPCFLCSFLPPPCFFS